MPAKGNIPHPQRFWDKIERGPACWEWQAKTTRGGYGLYLLNGKWQMAHRVAFEMIRGPIPTGLQLDHLCRNPRCVRPDHLEPVSGQENILRGNGPAAINARKNHCKRGHPLTPENTWTWRGERACKVCKCLLKRNRLAREAGPNYRPRGPYKVNQDRL